MKLFYFLIVALLFVACSNEPQIDLDIDDEGRFDSLQLENKSVLSSKIAESIMIQDSFPSKDSLLIFADIYRNEKASNLILLCNQAGYSKGE